MASLKDLLRYALRATEPPGHRGLEVAGRAVQSASHFPSVVQPIRVSACFIRDPPFWHGLLTVPSEHQEP